YVADRHLVFPRANGRDDRAQLRQRGRDADQQEADHARAETGLLGERVARLGQREAGDQDDPAGERRLDDERPQARALVLRRAATLAASKPSDHAPTPKIRTSPLITAMATKVSTSMPSAACSSMEGRETNEVKPPLWRAASAIASSRMLIEALPSRLLTASAGL